MCMEVINLEEKAKTNKIKETTTWKLEKTVGENS